MKQKPNDSIVTPVLTMATFAGRRPGWLLFKATELAQTPQDPCREFNRCSSTGKCWLEAWIATVCSQDLIYKLKAQGQIAVIIVWKCTAFPH